MADATQELLDALGQSGGGGTGGGGGINWNQTLLNGGKLVLTGNGAPIGNPTYSSELPAGAKWVILNKLATADGITFWSPAPGGGWLQASDQMVADLLGYNTQNTTVTIPGQPVKSPFEGVPEEEAPIWDPNFYRDAMTRQEQSQPQTRNVGDVFNFQGGIAQIDQNGNIRWIVEPPKPQATMSAPGGISDYWDENGNHMIWDSNQGGYIKSGYDATKDQSQQMTQYQKDQLDLQKQQLADQRAQAEIDRAWQQQQHLADLAAHPINWLQYAAETGNQPVVQPWMLPLSGGQYGLKAGQPIPGVTGTTTDFANMANTPNAAGLKLAGQPFQPMGFSGIPELLRPGAQYWARMGPTAQDQYLGYQQARTGISPEETEFRRQSTLPPGGRAPRLTWGR